MGADTIVPSLDDISLSALVDGLHEGPERSRVAWLRLREILRAEPERVTARICAAVEEAVAAGAPLPEQASIIPAVIACTRNQPNLVPESFLRKILSHAEQIDNLSLLCLANRIVQLSPESVLTKGLFEVLVATEQALSESQQESAGEIERYAKNIAVELWRTVASRDPATLVVVLEQWTEKVGWQRPSSYLFAELLIDALPRHPNLLGDTLAVLETIRAKLSQDRGEIESPDRFIDAVKRLIADARRKEVATKLAEAVAVEIERLEFPHFLVALPAVQACAPDPAVDRLIEDFLSPDPERVLVAREQLGQKMREANLALVQGIIEAADEVFELKPGSDLFRDLVLFLLYATDTRPGFVPAASLQRWAASDALDDSTLAICFAMLARVCPEWIMKHMLARALAVAVVANVAFSSAILVGLSRAWPELMLNLVRAWLEVMGWQEDLEASICAALEEIARAQPQKIEEMVSLLEQFRGHDPGPGFIDLRSRAIPQCIDRLRQIAMER